MNRKLNDLRFQTFPHDESVCVSICCITYNHSRFIEACLEGFLEQACDFKVEILIYDDASNDGTADIVRRYEARFPELFRCFLMSENQFSKGVNPYYSYLFPHARGRFVAICDGDDFWADPNKLRRQVEVLEAEPAVAITYGCVNAFNESGIIRGYDGGAKRDLSADELKAATPINTLTSCFRNIFDAGAPVFLRNSLVGDLTLWGLLGHYGTGKYLSDLLPAYYRIHGGGILSVKPRREQLIMSALAHLNLAGYHLSKGDESASIKSLSIMTGLLNDSGLVGLYQNSDLSFWGGLRLFRRLWRGRREAARHSLDKVEKERNKGR